MRRKAAARKLHALDAKLAQLAAERSALEIEAFDTTVDEARRRERYLALGDEALRRSLIRRERAFYALRREQRAAAVAYWNTVVAETRAMLDDLKSESPTSDWRRGIWWDVLTVFWIVTGAGWLAYSAAGAVVGAIIAAACGWFIVRQRNGRRPEDIRKGEQALFSSESELQQAQREADEVPEQALFSAAEEAAGTADATDR